MSSLNDARVTLLQTISITVFELSPPQSGDIEFMKTMQTKYFHESEIEQGKLIVKLGSLITSFIVQNPKKLTRIPVREAASAISKIKDYESEVLKSEKSGLDGRTSGVTSSLQTQLLSTFANIALEMGKESCNPELVKDSSLIKIQIVDYKSEIAKCSHFEKE